MRDADRKENRRVKVSIFAGKRVLMKYFVIGEN